MVVLKPILIVKTPDAKLESVEIRAIANEVILGLLGMTVAL